MVDPISSALSVSDAGGVVVLPLTEKLAPEVAVTLETVALAVKRPAPEAVPSDDSVTSATPPLPVRTDPALGLMPTSVPTSVWNWTISLSIVSPLRRRMARARTGWPARMLDVALPA